jgi:predicted nucleotidyltransferase
VLDLARCNPALLPLIDAVVTEIVAKSARLHVEDVMIVGASCRDILQSALGHAFALRTTDDIDLGLAVANWAAYDELTGQLPMVGHTGIRYQVVGVPADLMPFGAVEDPPGTVTPTARHEPMSVWAISART